MGESLLYAIENSNKCEQNLIANSKKYTAKIQTFSIKYTKFEMDNPLNREPE
jgi:hypothetical protein